MSGLKIDRELDSLNRTAKLFLDQGTANTLEESHAFLRVYRLHADFRVNNVGMQTALLTFINTAVRFALGGVTVSGNLDVPLRVPLPGHPTLADAVIAFGGRRVQGMQDCPNVIFGASTPRDPERAIKVIASGWAGGIAPIHMPVPISHWPATAPAAVFAGALAAAEGFSLLAGGSPMAGRQLTGLSLWKPEQIDNWLSTDATGPEITALPNDFWLLGLGHLGQAFLWTTMVSPYRNPAEVRFVLQDFDEITRSTLSTSILSTANMVGTMKTRAMSALLEDRGFNTTIIERRFDGTFRRNPEDPRVLICSVDNSAARKVLEEPRFPIAIESGIGRTQSDFRAFRIHTFPASRKAKDIWDDSHPANANADLSKYDALRSQGLDECGLTRLAETAVGAPFVGAAVAPLMFAQLLRMLHGQPALSVFDADLINLTRRRMVINGALDRLNPGYSKPNSSEVNAA